VLKTIGCKKWQKGGTMSQFFQQTFITSIIKVIHVQNTAEHFTETLNNGHNKVFEFVARNMVLFLFTLSVLYFLIISIVNLEMAGWK
jgi:hypothetical protein